MNTMPCMSLGQRIVGARLAAGYKRPSDLARAIGIDRQYLFNLENDKVAKPDPSRVALIAQAVNVSTEWLVTGQGSPERKLTLAANENELLDIFRMLSKDHQNAVLAVAASLQKGEL